ncbi:uncharacterized protein PHALS_12384 [Plasmopara halstedii]|uniref:Uncharacterized protein n=1 Tax=Plasmopara halstedii TaxID=4781 RepID=A0A0P1AM20_PLAHL|nr:uncharacterized protein PHALS_12384 [Plasmopara halstedii]CEG42078.1 hypothetical protein PHALS_12384 [Plasmopara halstedii]|eukprot:XP_024578447.1 hypothetical protein PHALS_12384 [Plasmopara halstedii]
MTRDYLTGCRESIWAGAVNYGWVLYFEHQGENTTITRVQVDNVLGDAPVIA